MGEDPLIHAAPTRTCGGGQLGFALEERRRTWFCWRRGVGRVASGPGFQAHGTRVEAAAEQLLPDAELPPRRRATPTARRSPPAPPPPDGASSESEPTRAFQLRLNRSPATSIEWLIVDEVEAEAPAPVHHKQLLAATSHLDMLNDAARNRAYRHAIEATVADPTSRVLDIG